MLCNTQNYWVFGLCPSCGILVQFLEYWTVEKVQKHSNSESNITLWRLMQSVLNYFPFFKNSSSRNETLCCITYFLIFISMTPLGDSFC
jgi:hypothetical protein